MQPEAPAAIDRASAPREGGPAGRAAARPLGWSPWVTVALPFAGAIVCRLVAGPGRWVSEPVHSTMETACGLIALLVASLLLLRRRTFAAEPQYAWVAVPLTCMGVLDLAHACVPQGPAFYWSRALPTLLGGVLTALVWFRPRAHAGRVLAVAVPLAGAGALALALSLVAYPAAWPLMFSPTGYTAAAKLLNVAGGLGFVAGATFFLREHRRGGAREDLVLADLGLLFGSAALLFGFAHMWGAVWWLIHALRLGAYAIVLAFVFDLYRRFQNLQGALEARLEFQQLMLGTVGHDMRGPIGAMKMTLDVLQRRGEAATPADRARALERLQRSVVRLEELVSGVLDFALARAGDGIPVERRWTALDDVVARAVDEVVAVHPQRAIEHAVVGDTRGSFDPARVAQVVVNLLQNAVTYGAAGTPIRLLVDGRGADEVVVSVHNAGEPIPPDVLPHVFEPFRRGRSPGAKRGVGLGLFIVCEIARAHGGDVSVRSTAREGTAFVVRLRRREGGASPPVEPDAPGAQPDATARCGSR